MNLPSFREITDKASDAFKRFPITLTWAITGSLIFIGIVNVNADALFDEYPETLLTFILGISWLIGARFFIEQFKNPEKWEWLKLATILLLILFYWHLPDLGQNHIDPKFYIRFFLYLLAGHLFLFFAPFVMHWDKSAYWNYLKAVCIAIGRSILFSGVLYLGLVLALLAIDSLFDADIDGKRYGQLFILCLGIVNTWTYLSDFPKDIQLQAAINYNKALEVFVKYILIPLVLLYLVILYAYSVKIVLEWDLPKGWVSYLVTALALLGFIIQVMVNPIQKTIKSWTINRFYPWFYILLLPLIVLLFVAIFKRIGDYGITENRYFVLIIAFWILGITIYLLFAKKKHLKVLPITLFILAILSSFGPWGAFSVSKNSQVRQFKEVFEKVRENKNIATGDQYDQLRSIVDYLGDRKAITRLDPIVGLSVHEICRDTSEFAYKIYDYNAPQRLLDTLGIEVAEKDRIVKSNSYFSYYTGNNVAHSYSISDYDYFAQLNLNIYEEVKPRIGNYTIRFDKRGTVIYLVPDQTGGKVLPILIKDKLIALSKYGNDLSKAKPEEVIIEAGNDSLFAKLIFTDLGFYMDKDSIALNHGNGFLFLKKE